MPSAPGSRTSEFTQQASTDLDEIEAYISRDNPDAALRVIRRIRETCFRLAEQPYMGVDRPEFNRPDLRSFVVCNTPYIIFYYPRDYGVEIAHIRHGSRALTDLFEQ